MAPPNNREPDERPIAERIIDFTWAFLRLYVPPACSPDDKERFYSGEPLQGATGFAYLAEWFSAFSSQLAIIGERPAGPELVALGKPYRQNRNHLVRTGRSHEIQSTPNEIATLYQSEVEIHLAMSQITAAVLSDKTGEKLVSEITKTVAHIVSHYGADLEAATVEAILTFKTELAALIAGDN